MYVLEIKKRELIMANTYFKMLNISTRDQFKENIITEVQRNLTASAKKINESLYDAVADIKSNKVSGKDLDINILLKYYMINQFLKETKEEVPTKQKLEETANPNIKFDKVENKFYKLTDKTFEVAETIKEVNKDGSYIVIEEKINSSYKTKKVYDKNDILTKLQLITSYGTAESNKHNAAEILNMRREFAKKHKYSGYSGNSSDLVASLLNKISAPVETGFYMDRACNFYKWSEYEKAFIRNLQYEQHSPLMRDYEFEENSIVIKKEYTGIVK